MIYLILIYVVVVILFVVYTKIGFLHIRKNSSLADVTSQDFVSAFRNVSIAIVIATVLALIIESIFIS